MADILQANIIVFPASREEPWSLTVEAEVNTFGDPIMLLLVGEHYMLLQPDPQLRALQVRRALESKRVNAVQALQNVLKPKDPAALGLDVSRKKKKAKVVTKEARPQKAAGLSKTMKKLGKLKIQTFDLLNKTARALSQREQSPDLNDIPASGSQLPSQHQEHDAYGQSGLGQANPSQGQSAPSFAAAPVPTTSSAGVPVSASNQVCFICSKGQLRGRNGKDIFPSLQCAGCKQFLHVRCAVYTPTANAQNGKSDYYCHNCRSKGKASQIN